MIACPPKAKSMFVVPVKNDCNDWGAECFTPGSYPYTSSPKRILAIWKMKSIFYAFSLGRPQAIFLENISQQQNTCNKDITSWSINYEIIWHLKFKIYYQGYMFWSGLSTHSLYPHLLHMHIDNRAKECNMHITRFESTTFATDQFLGCVSSYVMHVIN